MKITEATAVVRHFHRYLSLAERGESVQIRKHGRTVARLVPDADFMTGKQAAALFRSHQADALDRATARAIEVEIAKLDRDEDHALAR